MPPVSSSKVCVVYAEIGVQGKLGAETYLGEIRHQLDRALKRITFSAEGLQGRVKKRAEEPLTATDIGLSAGRMVGHAGECAVQIVFPDAEKGILAACEMRFRISTLTPAPGARFSLRVGCEYGRIQDLGQEIRGEAADTAKQLSAVAEPGQILTTRRTAAELAPGLRHALAPCKPVGAQVDYIMEIRCDALNGSRSTVPAAAYCLRLEHGDRRFLVDADSKGVNLGRDPASDLIVNHSKASRRHAWIGRRNGKFLLIDSSSNGTYVTFSDDKEVLVKHAELVLSGKGQIAFGHSATEAPEDVFHFEVRA